MKIRLLKCVLVGGKPTDPGTEIELPQADAMSLVRRGMAEQTEPQPAPPTGGVISTSEGLAPFSVDPPPPAPTRRNARK